MYDVIVLGATFAAAGIAQQFKEKCLVLERRAQAGYEFSGALCFAAEETAIYPYFENCHALFCAEIISVQKNEIGFMCVTHGVNGYCTYYAKKVIDTRCNDEMSISKTYNLLIESAEEPAFSTVHCERTGAKDRYILCCPVSLFCGYVEARSIAYRVIKQFSETQRVILLADEFDYRVKEGYPKTENGILYIPSKAYESPMQAFNAGLCIGEAMDK